MAGRPKGAKSADYEEKRLDLVRRLTRLCLATPHQRLSLREMAAGCDASVPTLKHYFGDRRGAVQAVLEQSWRDAAGFIERAKQPADSLEACIRRELGQFVEAFTRFGLDRLNTWAISEGLADEQTGPMYLRYFLEPSLQAAEAWLSFYRERGDIPRSVTPRHAALTLLAPCLLLFMHQQALGGSDVRPADIPAFVDEHATRFSAYLAAAGSAPQKPAKRRSSARAGK